MRTIKETVIHLEHGDDIVLTTETGLRVHVREDEGVLYFSADGEVRISGSVTVRDKEHRHLIDHGDDLQIVDPAINEFVRIAERTVSFAR